MGGKISFWLMKYCYKGRIFWEDEINFYGSWKSWKMVKFQKMGLWPEIWILLHLFVKVLWRFQPDWTWLNLSMRTPRFSNKYLAYFTWWNRLMTCGLINLFLWKSVTDYENLPICDVWSLNIEKKSWILYRLKVYEPCELLLNTMRSVLKGNVIFFIACEFHQMVADLTNT